MKDQAYQYLTKEEYSLRHSYLEDRLRVIENKLTLIENRGGWLHALWGYILGIIGFALTIWAAIRNFIH
jgi:hypothetical protein